MGVHEHKAGTPTRVGCVVITCSDTRTSETDTSGALMCRLLREHGHDVLGSHIIKDDPALIVASVRDAARQDGVQAILINGGTGISRRDSTFEAVDRLLEKRLDGFGELFRALSYQEIGSSAMMSRATAGIYQGRVVFSTPGSENAVRLAMEKLILPELGHLIKELTK
ncbi:MAG TPA: MogA/MoaB family molybdenum cofactor biosynthesis protein [Nitrospirales bacterium]|nr:MogA/MoaB family molybdenum cofactor biosynthesis protein [Nitrospirales bacterium]